METDFHEAIRRIIDQSVVEEISLQDTESMREHLGACVACRQYLESCGRVVEGLGAFSFGEYPLLRAKVIASLTRRAEELEDRRLVWGKCLMAVMQTLLGSFAVVQASSWMAAVLGIDPAQMRSGVIVLWIAPSLLMCVLFPVLPMLSDGWMVKRGRTL